MLSSQGVCKPLCSSARGVGSTEEQQKQLKRPNPEQDAKLGPVRLGTLQDALQESRERVDNVGDMDIRTLQHLKVYDNLDQPHNAADFARSLWTLHKRTVNYAKEGPRPGTDPSAFLMHHQTGPFAMTAVGAVPLRPCSFRGSPKLRNSLLQPWPSTVPWHLFGLFVARQEEPGFTTQGRSLNHGDGVLDNWTQVHAQSAQMASSPRSLSSI